MTRIVKINCEKWNRLGYMTLKISGIIGWASITIGLIYAAYTWFSFLPIVKFQSDWVVFVFVAILAVGGNALNLYFVFRTIYRNQNLIQFECLDGRRI